VLVIFWPVRVPVLASAVTVSSPKNKSKSGSAEASIDTWPPAVTANVPITAFKAWPVTDTVGFAVGLAITVPNVDVILWPVTATRAVPVTVSLPKLDVNSWPVGDTITSTATASVPSAVVKAWPVTTAIASCLPNDDNGPSAKAKIPRDSILTIKSELVYCAFL